MGMHTGSSPLHDPSAPQVRTLSPSSRWSRSHSYSTCRTVQPQLPSPGRTIESCSLIPHPHTHTTHHHHHHHHHHYHHLPECGQAYYRTLCAARFKQTYHLHNNKTILPSLLRPPFPPSAPPSPPPPTPTPTSIRQPVIQLTLVLHLPQDSAGTTILRPELSSWDQIHHLLTRLISFKPELSSSDQIIILVWRWRFCTEKQGAESPSSNQNYHLQTKM